MRLRLIKALENRLNKQELIEAITCLTFDSGWPNAMSVIFAAKGLSRKNRGYQATLTLSHSLGESARPQIDHARDKVTE